MNFRNISQTLLIACFLVLVAGTQESKAQIEYRWLSAGSFHNFYSSLGSEIEEGFINEQQGGWQWPAIYIGQDAQAMKGLWLGADNFTDDNGTTFDKRVVHVGPRVTGLGEFFPVSMKTTSKHAPPEVVVDGLLSFAKDVSNDEVDPSMKADRKIETVSNTLLGITVKRTIRQFSQQFHDNYHVIEYEFTNTGNTDGDDEIELPNQTVQGFVPYFINRMAPVKASRFTIGNGTGWGMNTMNDRRGDGLRVEPENFRAQFAWHGRFPSFMDANYDNIGGPIFVPNTSGGWLTSDDTTGRLVAYHFVGTVTLHADASAADDSDDPGQPFTMAEEHSDDALYSQNDAFDVAKMVEEYDVMTKGRNSTRHAYRVEPSGDSGFLSPTKDPALATSGGFSYTYGYGPYTLAPGESVKIVIAEGSAGISRELADETGAAFKAGDITALEKNQVVFQSRDSLFQTFNRAIANYDADYNIPESPEPPAIFSVQSLGGGIQLEWEYQGNVADIEGFEIYRATGRVDSTYRLLYEADKSEISALDGEEGRLNNPGKFKLDVPIRGIEYYYYIVTKGKVNNDNAGNTPVGKTLVSNRYYTQSYDPATLLRAPGTAMEQIRVVPNPYVATANSNLKFTDESSGQDRVYFYEIPGKATVKIYTELGELITTLSHQNLSGDLSWNLKTDSKQRISSGIYIARITNEDANSPDFGKVATRKLVIIF